MPYPAKEDKACLLLLLYPIGEHCQCAVAPVGVVVGNVHAEIVRATHSFMHREGHLQGGAFARF
jgi:hypothetical protein